MLSRQRVKKKRKEKRKREPHEAQKYGGGLGEEVLWVRSPLKLLRIPCAEHMHVWI